MKKLLTLLAVLLGITPYAFLATSIEDVKDTDEQFNCVVSKSRRDKHLLGLGSVNYDTGMKHAERKIILPYFFIDEDVLDAECRNGNFTIGHVDFVKPGAKIHIFTKQRVGKFLGHEILRERGIFMFGTGWDTDPENQGDEDRD